MVVTTLIFYSGKLITNMSFKKIDNSTEQKTKEKKEV
jgi:hypothetical protein